MATWSAIFASPSHGQVIRRPPIRPSDVTAPPKDAGAITKRPSPEEKESVAGGLWIKGLSAKRIDSGISIVGVIGNNSPKSLDGVAYTISRWNGNGWTTIAGGKDLSVGSNKSYDAAGFLNASNQAIKLKLDVSGPGVFGAPVVKKTKEWTLPARRTAFVVRYRAKRWALAADFKEGDTAGTIFEDARRHAATLNSLGFETQIRNTTNQEVLGGLSYRSLVFARTPTEQSRTFDNLPAAEEFRGSLRTLVRDRTNLSLGMVREEEVN
ncbi:MAG: hypothetical protein WD845_13890 [Pirellulales bacterium]